MAAKPFAQSIAAAIIKHVRIRSSRIKNNTAGQLSLHKSAPAITSIAPTPITEIAMTSHARLRLLAAATTS